MGIGTLRRYHARYSQAKPFDLKQPEPVVPEPVVEPTLDPGADPSADLGVDSEEQEDLSAE